MLDSIDVPLLEAWKNNFTNPQNKALDIKTESSVISLELLQKFIDDAKIKAPGYNGVRIYFIRYDEPHDQLRSNPSPNIEEIGNSGFSQASLALVPVKNFSKGALTGQDFVTGGKIFTLSFCNPNDAAVSIETGHCPPKCRT